MADGSAGGRGPDDQRPIDRWDALLEQIAGDVRRIREVVALAWYSGWVLLAMTVVVVILLA